MDKHLKEINDKYAYLLPQKEEGVVIFWLDQKIKDKEIDAHFTYQDFQRAVKETLGKEFGKLPQSHRILKSLLHNFIERPAGKSHRYKLTEYAHKFVYLLNHKLNNPFRNFPLKQSFERYADFSAKGIKHINEFNSWYQQGFHSTTRQTIVDHLEALKDEVASSIQELNKILYVKNQNLVSQVNKFTTVFLKLGEKADEIKNTLKLGSRLDQEIDKVVAFFYEKVENFKHPENKEETALFEEKENDFKTALKIKKDVTEFFQLVDEKLGQLREKIQFASSKLKELQDIFKYQTNFKANIRKFLTFALSEANYTKDEPKLPPHFPLKKLPFEEFKFIDLPYSDFFKIQENTVVQTGPDKVYELLEKYKVTTELKRQEKAAELFNKHKHALMESKKLNVTNIFYEILENQGDIEVAVKVGYELLQFASGKSEYKITIDREMMDQFKPNQVKTWKMNIQKN